MKRIFIIDWTLIPLFLLTAFTGIGLHIAAHWNNHELLHNWALAHIIASLLFTVFVIIHVKMHWGWYKGLFRNGLRHKSHITAIVSILFVILALTGYALLEMQITTSGLGLWHYDVGLLALFLFSGHIIKRFPILRKSKDYYLPLNRLLNIWRTHSVAKKREDEP